MPAASEGASPPPKPALRDRSDTARQTDNRTNGKIDLPGDDDHKSPPRHAVTGFAALGWRSFAAQGNMVS